LNAFSQNKLDTSIPMNHSFGDPLRVPKEMTRIYTALDKANFNDNSSRINQFDTNTATSVQYNDKIQSTTNLIGQQTTTTPTAEARRREQQPYDQGAYNSNPMLRLINKHNPNETQSQSSSYDVSKTGVSPIHTEYSSSDTDTSGMVHFLKDVDL
jgi:hypothetical protein